MEKEVDWRDEITSPEGLAQPLSSTIGAFKIKGRRLEGIRLVVGVIDLQKPKQDLFGSHQFVTGSLAGT